MHPNRFLRKHGPKGDTKAWRNARFRRAFGEILINEISNPSKIKLPSFCAERIDIPIRSSVIRLKRYGTL